MRSPLVFWLCLTAVPGWLFVSPTHSQDVRIVGRGMAGATAEDPSTNNTWESMAAERDPPGPEAAVAAEAVLDDEPIVLAGVICETVGAFDPRREVTFPSRLRANAVTIDPDVGDALLSSFQMELAFAGTTNLYFSVYELTGIEPSYIKLAETVRLGQIGLGLATETWYDSGSNWVDRTGSPAFPGGVPLRAGGDYIMGVSWGDTPVKVSSDNGPTPERISVGEVPGFMFRTGVTPPPDDDIGNPTIFDNGAYSMAFCFEPVEGACCRVGMDGQNNCAEVLPDQCRSAGDFFHGQRTTCSASACEFGRCCTDRGACQARYTQQACARETGTFWTDPPDNIGQECPAEATDLCPILVGACCTADGCAETREENCSGPFLGVGTTCDADTCIGACCLQDGCFRLSNQGCLDFQGTFAGPTTECGSLPPGEECGGACCRTVVDGGSTVCQIVSQRASCKWNPQFHELFYRGDSVSCPAEGETCVPAGTRGSCCLPDGSCLNTTKRFCTETVGLRAEFAEGATCTANTCTVKRCCKVDGTCDVTTATGCDGEWGPDPIDACADCPTPTGACCRDAGCTNAVEEANCADGVYLGHGTTCGVNDSACTGACCLVDGRCNDGISQVRCEDVGGGRFQLDETCLSTDCGADDQREACCATADGSCSLRFPADCLAIGGMSLGGGSVCLADSCPFGACCDGESCAEQLEDVCTNAGLSFLGDGTTCGDNPCETGACCDHAVSGDCKDTRRADCDVSPDSVDFMPGLLCADADTCEQEGACCTGDGECTLMLQDECEDPMVGGVFQGQRVECVNGTCRAGSCCLGARNCSDSGTSRYPRSCKGTGGAFVAGAVCDADFPCDPTGACCDSFGACSEVKEIDCAGNYHGDGTVCPASGLCGSCCDLGRCKDNLLPILCRLQGQTFVPDSTCVHDRPCVPTGACCDGDACSVVTQQFCQAQFGVYNGNGTTCDDGGRDCTTGACCGGTNNDCVNGQLESECSGTCQANRTCSGGPFDGHPCNEDGDCGEYGGDGSLCSDGGCDVGACCRSGECIETTRHDCAANGVFRGAGSTCETPGICPLWGACCEGGACNRKTEEDCTGTFFGIGTFCTGGRNCFLGACCGGADERCQDGTLLSDCGGECVDGLCSSGPFAGETCNGFSDCGEYGGNGTLCADVDVCTSGSCCQDDGTCLIRVPVEQCDDPGSFVLGGACSSDPCTPRGACCQEGSCSVLTRAACDAAFGTYGGDNSDCLPDTCLAGACCKDDGDCAAGASINRAACESLGGRYMGEGVACQDVDCTQGYCCQNDGTCLDQVVVDDCDDPTSFATSDDCSSDPCSPIGACCLPDGQPCDDTLTPAACETQQGVYQGDDASCVDVDCATQLGGCCREDGSCADDTSPQSCAAGNGQFAGAGTTCGESSCVTQLGACCDPTTQACVDAGGGGVRRENCQRLSWLRGRTCDQVGGVCPPVPTGACCDSETGACTNGRIEDDCAGVWHERHSCIEIDTACVVQPFGACCLPAACSILIEERCTDAGGTWQGADTACLVAITPANCAIDAGFPNGPVDLKQVPLGWDALTVQFACDLPSIGVEDFRVRQVEPGTVTPIIDRTSAGDGDVTVVLQQPIEPGRWTCLSHLDAEGEICVAALPADANNDGAANQQDIGDLANHLANPVGNPMESWQCDIDRSGSCAPPDLIGLIDELNGGGELNAWNEVSIPACPSAP